MSLIVKVRNHYTLQIGKDTANWIRGPKRIKIRDKRVLAGQMHKVEIIQDDGSPDPVIVPGNKPAGNEAAVTGGAQAGFGTKGSVEELLKEPENDEVARENERKRREVTALKIMEESNGTAQKRARERILDAARIQKESTAKHAAAGLVQEVSDDYVLSTEEHVTTDPTQVTVEELTTQARPITSRVEDSVLSVDDDPTAKELADADAQVIGDDAEARAAEAAKPKDEGIVVKGVEPAKLKRALELIGSGVLENIGEAGRIYEAIQKGLLVVKKPTEYRDDLEAHAEKKAGELVEAADVLLEKNKDLDAAYESLRGKVLELEAEVERLHNDPTVLEFRTKVRELDRDNDALRSALSKSEGDLIGAREKLDNTTEGRDEALQKLADVTAKATATKTAAAKKAAKKGEAMQKPEKNRMMGGATKTRDQKDVPKDTKPAPKDTDTRTSEESKE